MIVQALSKEYRDSECYFVMLNGEDNLDVQSMNVLAFEHDSDCRIIIANLQCGEACWNLNTANHVIFAEIPFTVGSLTQAEARCHRIGQQKEVIRYLFYVETEFYRIQKLNNEMNRIHDFYSQICLKGDPDIVHTNFNFYHSSSEIHGAATMDIDIQNDLIMKAFDSYTSNNLILRNRNDNENYNNNDDDTDDDDNDIPFMRSIKAKRPKYLDENIVADYNTVNLRLEGVTTGKIKK